MSRKAVVFGGSGFIGGHLVAALAERGYERIVSADLRPSANRTAGVEYVTCDLREPVGRQIQGDFDEAYNLAAVHTTPGHADHEYYDANVFGALHVTRFCEEHGVRSLVFTSSISVYGPSEEAKSEASLPAPVSAYGKSKLQAEGIHEMWQRAAADRRLAVARLAVIFGPREGGNFTRLARALATNTFLYPGRKDTIKGCAYVGEVIRTFRFALERPERLYTYNVAYPEPYTLERICAAFHEVGGLPRPKGTLPTSVMKAGVLPFEVLSAIGIRNPICRARVDKLVHSTYIVPGRLLADGYSFETDLDEALRRWLAAAPSGRFE